MSELPSRRDFCAAAAGTCAVALGLPGCGSAPMNTSMIVNAGPPSAIQVGAAVFYKAGRLFICRDANGIFAVSSNCQHMHCDIDHNEGVDQSGNMFFYLCPCHQSGYAYDGAIVHGPTVRPLYHHPVSLDPVTGDVMADGTVQLLTDADKAMRLKV
jgi:Rieske Fe-S protein